MSIKVQLTPPETIVALDIVVVAVVVSVAVADFVVFVIVLALFVVTDHILLK